VAEADLTLKLNYSTWGFNVKNIGFFVPREFVDSYLNGAWGVKNKGPIFIKHTDQTAASRSSVEP
jgi:hypothetical protein